RSHPAASLRRPAALRRPPDPASRRRLRAHEPARPPALLRLHPRLRHLAGGARRLPGQRDERLRRLVDGGGGAEPPRARGARLVARRRRLWRLRRPDRPGPVAPERHRAGRLGDPGPAQVALSAVRMRLAARSRARTPGPAFEMTPDYLKDATVSGDEVNFSDR